MQMAVAMRAAGAERRKSDHDHGLAGRAGKAERGKGMLCTARRDEPKKAVRVQPQRRGRSWSRRRLQVRADSVELRCRQRRCSEATA